MRRTAYILEDGKHYPADRQASFQVINASTGHHVGPLFSTLTEAIGFFDRLRDYEWNGHVEVRRRGVGAR